MNLPERRLKLNNRLLPWLVGVLVVMQLIAPYKGWMILLVGLGSVWLVSFVWTSFLGNNLSLSREIRFGWAQVGDRLEERFTLANSGPIPALWVEVIDHSTMPDYRVSRVTGVAGLSRNRWHTQRVCTQRGTFMLGPTTLQTGDPFGFYKLTLDYPAAIPLTVTPPVVPLPAIEVSPGGRAGEGRSRPDPFERTVSVNGVRAYVSGDSLNWIHWPTSARQGSLFVRLFDSTPSGDWLIFLDLDRQAQVGEGGDSTSEHSIILSASLAARGLQRGQAVGLVTHGQELVWLPPRTGDSQRREILRALALIEPGSRSLAELLSRAYPASGQITSVIIITAAARGDWIETLFPLIRRGAVPTVLLLDPASFGGEAELQGVPALLNDLGVTPYVISRDLLDRPEARPGQQGQWEWQVSAMGRAKAVNAPRDMSWRALS